MRLNKLVTFSLMITAFVCAGVQPIHFVAQTPPRVQSGPQKKSGSPSTSASGPLIVETVSTGPQVVTLLHRISGLKMFRLLLRSGDVRAIDRLDDGFTINGEVHTNVIAGLALDDGETIAAWMPEVDAEIGPPLPPVAPKAPGTTPQAPWTKGLALPESSSGVATTPGFGNLFGSPDVTVIARDRKRLSARYIGLDGVTGLSVLKLPRNSLPGPETMIDAKEKAIAPGQRVHLFGPERAAEAEATTGGPVYVRIAETEGRITNLMRAPSGSLQRLEISSPRVSAANIGGIALNDDGQTLGIVAAVNGTEATILPAALVRGAAKRVLDRQASVPRPWLGIHGEPLGAFPLEQLLKNGWQSELAKSIADEHRGILLTSIAPGSPASRAALRPGDVILQVNEDEIRSADDFSWLLEEAGSGGSLRFTLARPGKAAREAVEVKLSESPDPFFGLRAATAPLVGTLPDPDSVPFLEVLRGPFSDSLANSLIACGVETIGLKPRVASRFGASGGLLVVYVQPLSVAEKAGLLPGDVIEAIDGQELSATRTPIALATTPSATYSFSVVRKKQKLIITVVTAPSEGKR